MEKTITLKTLKEDISYVCGSGDTLYTYYEQSSEAFHDICKDLKNQGFKLYGKREINNNLFATYVKGERMAHIYWIACESKINVVLSEENGANLPAKEVGKEGHSYATSVTQLQSYEINGMGYVVQLADGSFLVYDGGYEHRVDELWDTLVTLKHGEEDIRIRAWVITHSHGDHYPCVTAFADKYADRVTLEMVMIAPPTMDITNDKEELTYLNTRVKEDVSKFKNTKICYVYTGMCFTFCDVTMEILFTPDELYSSQMTKDFNNTSIVSRICTDDRNMLFLADAGSSVAYKMALYYGDYLKSDMCQISHHGVEDFPLTVYRFIKAPVLWYPCDTSLYNLTNRDANVRAALKNSKYTKEILLHDKERFTRPLRGTKNL